MSLIQFDRNRDDAPSIVIIAVICILISVFSGSITAMMLGLAVFTLCGLQMMLRPSYSFPDHGAGCAASALMTVVWSIILLEFYYSDDYIRSIMGYIIWASIILYSILYLVINKKVNDLKDLKRR